MEHWDIYVNQSRFLSSVGSSVRLQLKDRNSQSIWPSLVWMECNEN